MSFCTYFLSVALDIRIGILNSLLFLEFHNCYTSLIFKTFKSVFSDWVPSSRLLRVPWTERRSNQSILKEISPEYSLEGLMLKLKLQYFGHLCEELTHWKRTWCLERLKAGEEGGNREWDSWMASLTWWTWVWASSGSWWWTRKPEVLQSMGLQRVRHNWTPELNWT